MNIIFFAHPSFLAHQSMPRYVKWLADGMNKRGHHVTVLSPQSYFSKLPAPAALKKWMGYLDQYIVFPKEVKRKIKKVAPDTLFVFSDHALGPWVPIVEKKLNVVHCHDFLAQKSALGQIPQNPTGWTGRQYQAYIRKGYAKGKNFISISHKTENDLLQLLPTKPRISNVVYNGVNPIFTVREKSKALAALQEKLAVNLTNGFVLHVGGNQWYKNRVGIVLLYNIWRSIYNNNIPLLLLGEKPDILLEETINNSPYRESILPFSGLSDEDIINAYNAATVFLFPSLAEGFGWPIAEAMACGCPVITTGEAPMTEVGADAATYIPKMPLKKEYLKEWLHAGAATIQKMISMPTNDRNAIQLKGLENVKRFDSEKALDQIESIYKSIVTA